MHLLQAYIPPKHGCQNFSKGPAIISKDQTGFFRQSSFTIRLLKMSLSVLFLMMQRKHLTRSNGRTFFAVQDSFRLVLVQTLLHGLYYSIHTPQLQYVLIHNGQHLSAYIAEPASGAPWAPCFSICPSSRLPQHSALAWIYLAPWGVTLSTGSHFMVTTFCF